MDNTTTTTARVQELTINSEDFKLAYVDDRRHVILLDKHPPRRTVIRLKTRQQQVRNR